MESGNSGRSKTKSVFVCQSCGKESLKWLGHCPECLSWGTFSETVIAPARSSSYKNFRSNDNIPREILQVTKGASPRFCLGIAEVDRVLGGGLVPGSLVLVGGEPGIGKSTLLLQVSVALTTNGSKVLYISGEESVEQVKLRTERLGIDGQGLYLLCETNLSMIMEHLEKVSPAMVIVDSIQTLYLDEVAGAPGSISQVRDCTLVLMHWAKQNNVPVLIAGHVTKEGVIAGPSTLEHIVDVVLYLEGERLCSHRILRGRKNRFGSTNEMGLFEMREDGLREVRNPSNLFLSQYGDAAVGSVVVATVEGSRPLLVEIQALTAPAGFGPPRRVANGIDFNRLLLVVSVLARRAGLKLFNQDVLVNVTGGLRIGETAVDLGVVLSVASSFLDRKPLDRLVAIGEIGLSGEIRQVPQMERRIAEAARLGFKNIIVPALATVVPTRMGEGLRLLKASTIKEALSQAFVMEGKRG